MRTPIAPAALFYSAGVLLGDWLPLPWQGLIAASALLAVAVPLCNLHASAARAGHWLLLGLIVVMGWTGMTLRTAVISPVDLRRQAGEEAVLATVRGRVATLPQERVYLRGDQEQWRTMVTLEVEAWRTNGVWQPAFGDVAVTTPGQAGEPLARGERVEISGVLAPPPGPLAPDLFNYRAYLRRQGISFQLKAESFQDWARPATGRGLGWEQRFIAWAQQALGRGLPEADLTLKLLWNMTLGARAGLTNEVFVPFARAGTMHIFAISGLHIALITGILAGFFRLFCPRPVCGALVLPLIWAYTAATGWQPSAVRSAIMSSVVLAGWMLARPNNMVNSLATAALLILVWDARQLFQAGFQLSFMAVLSMAMIIPRLEHLRDRWFRHDPMLAEDAISSWNRRALRFFRFSTACVLTTLAAWLGTLPLTAWYFSLLSPVSLLANLLAVPASSAALACNMGSLFLSIPGWCPWMVEVLNNSAWASMKVMVWVSHWGAETRWGWMQVPRPSLAMCVGYYAVLAGLLLGSDLPEKWRQAVRILVVSSFALCGWDFIRTNSESRVTVLPLSGGASILVEPESGAIPLLVDCGRSNSVDAIVAPLLRARGVNRVARFALSHGDIQNMGGALEVCAEFHPGAVWISGQRCRSPVYRLVTATLETNAAGLKRLARGDTVDGWRVLHPEADRTYSRADDGTLCLAREMNGRTVLLLSDLGASGQQALAASGQNLRADIVVTGLPDDGEPLRQDLLDAIQPGGIIISDSLFPATARANKQLRERLARTGARVWYGSDAGALEVRISRHGWTVVNAEGIAVESWHRRKQPD